MVNKMKNDELYKKDLTYYVGADGIVESGYFGGVCDTNDGRGIYGYPWYHCRESFARHVFLENCKAFLFAHADGYGPRIAAFIRAAEERLKLKDFSMISGFKNVENRSLIHFTPWWAKNEMRRQLFTLLLRCGRNYGQHTGDFEGALYSCAYMTDTQPAVEKFFAGNTMFDGEMTWVHGWHYTFKERRAVLNVPLMRKPVSKSSNAILRKRLHGVRAVRRARLTW